MVDPILEPHLSKLKENRVSLEFESLFPSLSHTPSFPLSLPPFLYVRTCTVALSAWLMLPVKKSIKEKGSTWSWKPSWRKVERRKEGRQKR